MIVITTPTGQIGRQVLADVLDGAGTEPVRVIVRDPARLPEQVRRRVEAVEGSHGEATVLDRAFKDADAVFWLVPPDDEAASIEQAYAGFARPAVAAFERHGVRRVVGVSALGRGTDVADRAGHVTATLAMDDLIAGSGVAYRALTMPSFMDNLLWQAASIKNGGTFFEPIDADRELPSVATRDIAAAAARLLLDQTWNGVAEQPVLGPEDLSYNDMARIISEVLETPVRYQQIPFETFTANLTGRGMSQAVAQAMTDMMAAKNAGLDNAAIRTPLTSTPTSFRQWCQDTLKPAVQAQ
ncbi:NAD(P)H-binding protein [Catenulispora pinisilvae]|uniref:NAD(P)H-binding protein n=1 Tax=Catenulispora pinisilvae TaxID=2705253 RepID=UPI0018914C3B|nr:NAD(P)H-binding protein [Catenulispora pinisilvae]